MSLCTETWTDCIINEYCERQTLNTLYDFISTPTVRGLISTQITTFNHMSIKGNGLFWEALTNDLTSNSHFNI